MNIQNMNILDKFIEKDNFAKYTGIEIIDYSKGYAKAKMNVRDIHLNSAGTVHGGVLFSLADSAFAVASNSYGTIAMAINVSISYFKAVSKGILFAEAREVSLNPRLATYVIEIKDEEGNIVAFFQGTVYRKKESLDEIL